MKIKRCRKCGKQFVSRTEICPFCRTENKWHFVSLKNILILSIVAFTYVFPSHFLNEKSKGSDDLTDENIAIQKEDRKSSDFPGNIEQHYRQLVDSYNAGNFNLAIKELILFRENNRIGYRNVDRIKNKLITQLDQKVRDVPVSETFENLTMYQQLLDLDPENPRYKNKVRFYKKKYENRR